MNEPREMLRIARELLASDYDIKGRYRYWNAKAFGGELPMVPLGWTRSKRVGGHVKATMKVPNPQLYRITREANITITKLALSNFLVYNEEQLDEILLHEMIHVYVLGILSLNESSGGHGREFLRKRKEVQSKTGIKIPLTEDISGLEISDEVKTKPFGLVLTKRGGKLLMQMMNLNTFSRYRDEIVEYMTSPNSSYLFPWARLIISDERELLKYPVQRKFKRTWNVMGDKDLWSSIMSSGRVVEAIG